MEAALLRYPITRTHHLKVRIRALICLMFLFNTGFVGTQLSQPAFANQVMLQEKKPTN